MLRQFSTAWARSMRRPASRISTEWPRALSWSAIIAPTTPEPTTTMSARVAVGGEFCLSHRVAPGEAIREARRHGRRSRRRRRPPERAIAAIGGHGERVAHGLVHQRLFIGDDDGGRPASHGARVPGGDDVAGQVLQPGLPGRGHQRVGGGMAGGQRGQPGPVAGLTHAGTLQRVAHAARGDGVQVGVVGQRARQRENHRRPRARQTVARRVEHRAGRDRPAVRLQARRPGPA